MPIRTNTNPRPLELTPELQDILLRNGMQAHVAASDNGFALLVQGHDSPLLNYPITEKQLKALTDWGTNTANRKAYNTFASIVAADFDMPKDFVHARNANGRVAMGLHGYRIGVGEYGRGAPYRRFPVPPHHMMGWSFLGWTPRMQEGFHLRRIGGQLYYPGAPMVPNRPDGRMKPGELQSGGYGFYYKGYNTAPVAEKDVLAGHGILVDAVSKTVTIQSSTLDADLQYSLSDEELAVLASNSVKDHPIDKRLETLNNVIKEDFADAVTMDMLNSDKLIDIRLHPEVQADLDQKANRQEEYYRQETNPQDYQVEREPSLRDNLPKGGVVMDGNALSLIDSNKGWFREGRHGREVTVDDIRVEPVQGEGEVKYRMTAVIDGEVVSHEISQKQYEKFMALDDLHRMKLFSKVFKEVDMKDRYPVGLGTKISAALLAGAVVTHDLLRDPNPMPDIYVEGHRDPMPHVYFKPGVDSPADVAARQFDAMKNLPDDRVPGMGHGL